MRWDETTRRALPSAAVTDLHLFRHGRADTGGRRLVYGHADFPLAAVGESESRDLLEHACRTLPRPDGVWSSDLQRCRALAEPLATRFGVPLELDVALREQDMGAWEGRAWEELTAEDEPGVHAYWTRYAEAAPPGGESYGALAARVGGWLERNSGRSGSRRWFVVTHVGVVRAMCCRALGLTPAEALRFTPPHASHSWLQLAEAGGVVVSIGERPSAVVPPEELSRPLAIAVSGSAGTGKTTLCRALAARLDVPLVAEGMRRRLEAGLEVHALDHDGFRALVRDLWEEHRAAEDEALRTAGGFVADRCSLDFAAFWLNYRFTDDIDGTASLFTETLERARRYDRIALLPWGVLPLVADGVRATNPWIQRHFQATVEGLLLREIGPPRLLVLPAISGLDDRLTWVMARLPTRP